MKTNICLAVIFLSFTLLAYSSLSEDFIQRIGGTELNGNGCVCHDVYEDSSVVVWVEGPDTLRVGETGLYKMYMTGGPAEAGGYNVAGRYGVMGLVDTLSVWDYRASNELTQAFPLPFPTPLDTIFWPFEYTASGLSNVDTIYSVGLSIVYDSIPDFNDKWAFGPKFPLAVIDDPVPAELNVESLPPGFELSQNYPNPFNPITKIKFVIPKSSFVNLRVYDILGNKVATLVDEEKPEGEYEVDFSARGGSAFGGNASGLSSGVYYYKLQSGDFSQTKKMLYLK